jgi:hypothetical protein
MKAYGGSAGVFPVINLENSYRCVANFTLRPLYTGPQAAGPTEQEAMWALHAVWTFWQEG